MKMLSIASEYPPYGSGIANAAFYINNIFRRLGYTVDVIHPGNIKPGSRHFRRRYGLVSLLNFWRNMPSIVESISDNYNIIFLHQPFFTKALQIRRPIIALFHITYWGKWQAFKTYFPHAPETLYYKVASAVEQLSFKKMLQSTGEKITIVAPSDSVAQEIKQINPVKNIHVISFGVDSNFSTELASKSRTYQESSDDNVNFIWVGRVTKVKNPEYAVKLLAKIIDEGKKARLTFVGDGPLRKKLVKMSKKVGLETKIHFTGYIQHSEVARIMRQHDLALSTSIYESFSLSTLESLASGLPPVVSDIPSLREIVNYNRVGCIFPLQNVDFATKQIVRYLNSLRYSKDKERIASRGLALRYREKEILKQYKKLLSCVYLENVFPSL
jgi:1,2-diacylglycerol 3-alpha-glucosyltransferase